MRARIFATVISISLVLGITPADAALIGPNVDITASDDLNNRQQAEPTIAVNPGDPNILVAGAQDYRLVAQGNHRWHGYYRSTDGGRTWSVSLLPGFPGDGSPEGQGSPLRNFNTLSDPVLAFDRLGNVYYTGIAFNVDSSGACCFSLTAFVARYIDDGANYDGVALIDPCSSADKPWIAVDTTLGVHSGNVYVVFDGPCAGQSSGTVFTRSIDGGRTFSSPVLVGQGLSPRLGESQWTRREECWSHSLARARTGTTSTSPGRTMVAQVSVALLRLPRA